MRHKVKQVNRETLTDEMRQNKKDRYREKDTERQGETGSER